MEEISIHATMPSGERRTIEGLPVQASLSDLRCAVAAAFGMSGTNIRILRADGQPLVGSSGSTSFEIGDGLELTVLNAEEVDLFDQLRTENGMVITDDGRTITKERGADLTSACGQIVVECGYRRWDLNINNHRGNMMIGVAGPEVPLDLVQRAWKLQRNSNEALEGYSDRWSWIKSPGNTTGVLCNKPTVDFQAGDVISVEFDADIGVASFKKNGSDIGERQFIQAPVSLWINFDYDEESVSILEYYE